MQERSDGQIGKMSVVMGGKLKNDNTSINYEPEIILSLNHNIITGDCDLYSVSFKVFVSQKDANNFIKDIINFYLNMNKTITSIKAVEDFMAKIIK